MPQIYYLSNSAEHLVNQRFFITYWNPDKFFSSLTSAAVFMTCAIVHLAQSHPQSLRFPLILGVDQKDRSLWERDCTPIGVSDAN